jgi:hypothetical protein
MCQGSSKQLPHLVFGGEFLNHDDFGLNQSKVIS